MINSSIFKELAYGKASDTFHNWADAVHMYGLNFALDVALGAWTAFFQHIVLKEQNVHVLGISRLPVSTF